MFYRRMQSIVEKQRYANIMILMHINEYLHDLPVHRSNIPNFINVTLLVL